MKEVKVLINTIERIKEFGTLISQAKCDVDVISGRYVINAKSIMGLFSVDATKPVTVCIRSADEEEYKKVVESIKEFIVIE